MAATDQRDGNGRTPGGGVSLLAAALALPGLLGAVTGAAHAESAPDQTTVGVKYTHYEDWQPYDPGQPAQSGARMKVSSPLVWWQAPVGSQLAIQGSATLDTMSGASPKYHNTLSGASAMGGIKDRRKAFDLKVTRYAGQIASSAGLAYSTENDYTSYTLSGDIRFSTPDNNRTWAFGASVGRDRIDAASVGVTGRHRNTVELLFGVTQVLTPVDLAQLNLTYSSGHGYFSDPYKNLYGKDVRPDKRDQVALLARHHHHFDSLDATLRSSVRYYSDSWSIRGVALGAEWAQELKGGWTLTPNVRIASQSSANFYYDPPYPNGTAVPLYSADTRLSAFGGRTYGMKVEKEVGQASRVEVKLEKYEQRASWRLGGTGSTGVLPLRALYWQLGWSTRF